jgi:dTMP kinase
MIQKWIDNNTLVIVDRYVFSNIAYQCAKVQCMEEKQKLKDWILHLEYGYHNIPRPDINVFFDVPFDFTVKNLTSGRQGDDRSYLQGGTDIHEADMDFQSRVREMYLLMAKTEPSLKLISCHDENGMMKPEVIFSKLLKELNL